MTSIRVFCKRHGAGGVSRRTFQRRRLTAVVAVACLSGMAPAERPLETAAPLGAPASTETIRQLVKDLSDHAYEQRTHATRRLTAIGMSAVEELRAAARGTDAEAALRAKKVLDQLEQGFFGGAEVHLSFSDTTVAWDETVNLRVTVKNPTPFPVRIPFDIRADQQSGVAEALDDPSVSKSDDARQVGDMLDLGDFLRVRDAEGRPINLSVDDTGSDPAVDAAVRGRSSGHGPIHTLGAGEQVVLTARSFNRGWARYALLDAGKYVVEFDYIPEWDDPVLTEERVGQVTSNEATLTVTESAPEAVSRAGVKANLTLRQEGEFLIAGVTNRSDMRSYVNTNFGATLPFAEGVWVYERDDTRREVRVNQKQSASWRDFDSQRLIVVWPGDTIEVVRVAVADLRRALGEVGADLEAAHWSLHFRYMNLCDRHWQDKQGSAFQDDPDVPSVLLQPLPRRMLVARYNSNQLVSPSAE